MRTQCLVSKPVICEEISIDSSLNITQQLKKEQNDQVEIDIRRQLIKIEQQKNSAASIEFAIKNNSYSVVYQAQEDLLDQLDYLLDSQHQGKNTLTDVDKWANQIHQDYKNDQKVDKVRKNNQKRFKTDIDIKTDLNRKNQVQSRNNAEDLEEATILEMNKELEDLQCLMKDYRNQLKNYQGQLQKKAQDQLQEKQWLKNNIDELIKKLDKSQNIKIQQQREMSYLIQKNKQLLEQNKDLKKEIAKLTRSSSNSKSRASHVMSMRTKFSINNFHNNRHLAEEDTQYFTQAIRQQLQSMVESLVVEVEHLRGVNDKLKDQITHLNQQLIESQKTVKKKNQKLYHLEMCMLNNRRESRLQFNPSQKLNCVRNTQIINSNAQLLNEMPIVRFSFADLINNRRHVSANQKLIIAFRLIELYERRIKDSDFEMLMAQDLTIQYRCGQISSIEILIYGLRSSKSTSERLSRQKKENLKDNVIWNLNFMLDELFKTKSDNKMYRTVLQQNIMNKIQTIFQDNNAVKMQSIQEIKQIIISSLKKDNILLSKDNNY